MTDLRSVVLALVAPLGIGSEIAPGARIVDVSTEVALRIVVLLDDDAEISIELAPLTTGRSHAAQTAQLGLAWRSGDRTRIVDGRRARALCESLAGVIRTNEVEVLARVRADADESPSSARIREVRVDRVLERGGEGRDRFHTLSPYVGCLVGCRFCYADAPLAVLRSVAGLPAVPWGSWVDARINAAEVLETELEALPPLPIKLCPIVSDPWHAIERRFRITRGCLEVLARTTRPRPVLTLTRSPFALDDVETLASIPRAWGGVSLPTIDDTVRAHFEPRAASVDERLALLDAYREAGVRTFAVVQPILPGSIEALADALAARADSVRVDLLDGIGGASSEFGDPRWSMASDPAWQEARAMELVAALRARSVPLWKGEVPPELSERADDHAST